MPFSALPFNLLDLEKAMSGCFNLSSGLCDFGLYCSNVSSRLHCSSSLLSLLPRTSSPSSQERTPRTPRRTGARAHTANRGSLKTDLYCVQSTVYADHRARPSAIITMASPASAGNSPPVEPARNCTRRPMTARPARQPCAKFAVGLSRQGHTVKVHVEPTMSIARFVSGILFVSTPHRIP